MAPKPKTKTAAAPTFLYYDYKEGQKTFGWLTPKQAQIRSAAKRASVRKTETAKRDYACPSEGWKKRRGKIKEKKKPVE